MTEQAAKQKEFSLTRPFVVHLCTPPTRQRILSYPNDFKRKRTKRKKLHIGNMNTITEKEKARKESFLFLERSRETCLTIHNGISQIPWPSNDLLQKVVDLLDKTKDGFKWLKRRRNEKETVGE